MLVLEATSKRQGERDGDYHWCTDGELAYQQGIDCQRPDCGCERGWAGFDSHRATTTVEVVDRPDFTVADLAAELARSLCDGGWIDAADPSHDMVVAFVDEIIEYAGHFGEGAVLERDGEWIRERDGSTEPINPLDRVTLEQLTEPIVGASPLDVLVNASALMHDASNFLIPLLEALHSAAWPEAQLLGHVIEWLWDTSEPDGWDGVPDWAQQLHSISITAARRRKLDVGPQYLLELALDSGVLGTMAVLLGKDGAIATTWFAREDVAQHQKLIKALQRGSETAPFRRISVHTAASELHLASLAISHDEPPAWNPIRQNRALVNRVLSSATWVG